MPDALSDEQAAGALLQGMTAHAFVVDAFPVQAGQDVLVHAAAGGLGLLLTQLASARGARVIGTVSTPEKAELARGAGAAEIVNYSETDDLAAAVRDLTDGDGVARRLRRGGCRRPSTPAWRRCAGAACSCCAARPAGRCRRSIRSGSTRRARCT